MCPIRAMTLYSMLVKIIMILLWSSGHPLTQKQVIRCLLQRGEINQGNYASHSFQIGMATTATAAGLLACLIKTLT